MVRRKNQEEDWYTAYHAIKKIDIINSIYLMDSGKVLFKNIKIVII